MSYKQPLINAIYRLSLFLLFLCSIGANELYANGNYRPRNLRRFASTQEKIDWFMGTVKASNAINILFANHPSLKAQYLVYIERREFTKANLVVRKIDSETLSEQQESYKEYLLNQENRQSIVDEVELRRRGRRLYDGIEDAEVLSGGELGDNPENNIAKAPQTPEKEYSREAFELAAKLTGELLEKKITSKPLFHYKRKADAQHDQKRIEGGTTPKQELTFPL